MRGDGEFGGLAGLISVPYWFLIIPAWLGKRRKD
jgi:hypothetical protein